MLTWKLQATGYYLLLPFCFVNSLYVHFVQNKCKIAEQKLLCNYSVLIANWVNNFH